ncbi:MAG: outer membrane beta-barrel protein [Flavobacteriales bacterium]
MKQALTIFFLLLFAAPAFAQDSIPRHTQHQKKRKWLKRKRALFSEDGVAVDIVSNLWLTTPTGIIQKPFKSIGYNISIYKDWPLGHSSFTIALGLGYCVENVQNNGQFLYTSNNTQTFLYPLQVPYTSNRLTSEWVEIPLEIRLRTKGNGPFRFYLGAKAGIDVANYYQFMDHDTKLREYNVKNLNWYRYGVYSRLGYGYFNLFAYYGLSEVFMHGRGPVLTPAAVGLSVMLR